MDCPVCGAPDQRGRFCAECGARLTVDPAPRPPGAGLEAQRPGCLGRLRPLLIGAVAVLMTACVALIVVASVPNPVALGLGLAAAVVPALVYAGVILRLDRYEAEPVRAVLASFGWGAIGAVLFSVVGGLLFQGALGAAVSPEAGEFLSLSVGAPLIEESFKGIALLALLAFFRQEFDNVLDGLVYGALVGLGFAMTENVLYLGTEYLEQGLAGLTQLFVARALIGGFGHAAYTATTGAAVGWARERHRRGALRFVVPVLGWAAAVLLHAAWNTGTIVVAYGLGENASVVVVVLALAIVVLAPALIVLAVIARLAARRELRIMAEALAGEVAGGALTPAEYGTLTDPRARAEALRRAQIQGGRQRRRLQDRFFQTAANLAFRLYHLSRGEPPKPGQQAPESAYRAELARIRGELDE